MRGSKTLLRDAGGLIVQAAVVVWLVVSIVFLLVRAIPGDPAQAALGSRGTPEAIAALRVQLGLDRPLLEQYLTFLRDLATGNLGTSLAQEGRPVSDIVFPALGVTATVVCLAALLSLVAGVAWGLAAGLARSRRVDAANRIAAIALLASPPFWIGLLLISTLAVGAGILPAGGWSNEWPSAIKYVWLPALALCAYLTPVIMRVVRQSASDIAQGPFVEAAIARGISSARIVGRHILPNSLLPVVTIVFINVGVLLSGAVVIEAIFALPGLGTALNIAIAQRDYQVVQAATVLAAIAVVLANMMGDAVNRIVDPRVRIVA